MGITEILWRIWLFSANQIKSSESFSKQPTQLIVELNSSLRQIIDSQHLFSATQHAVLTWIIQFQEDVPKACSNVLIIKIKDYQWKKYFQLHNLITFAEICLEIQIRRRFECVIGKDRNHRCRIWRSPVKKVVGIHWLQQPSRQQGLFSSFIIYDLWDHDYHLIIYLNTCLSSYLLLT